MELFSRDAEMSYLGSLMLINSPTDLQDAIQVVPNEDIYVPAHKSIHRAIKSLNMVGSAIDIVTVKNELGTYLPNVGGVEYIMQLAEFVPSASNWLHYAEIIKREAYRRRVLEYGQTLVAASSQDVETIKTAIKNRPLERATSAPIELGDLDFPPVPPGVKTGLKCIDSLTGCGLVSGQVSVIAAPPKCGKTAIMCQIAHSMAKKGHRVVYALFADLSPAELLRRLFIGEVGKTYPRELSDFAALAEIKKLPFRIFNKKQHGRTVGDLRAFLRQLERDDWPAQVVVCDYAQRMRPNEKYRDRVESAEAASEAINELAEDFEIPVLLGSQVSLDHSGGIVTKNAKAWEEDAGFVVHVTPDKDQATNKNFNVDLNRFGPARTHSIFWDTKTLRLVEDAR